MNNHQSGALTPSANIKSQRPPVSHRAGGRSLLWERDDDDGPLFETG